jgi:signal transduction histidine kinase
VVVGGFSETDHELFSIGSRWPLGSPGVIDNVRQDRSPRPRRPGQRERGDRGFGTLVGDALTGRQSEVDRVFRLEPGAFDVAGVVRFEPGPELVVLGVSREVEAVPLGSRFPPDDLFAPTRVLRTGRSARVSADDLESAATKVADSLRHHGYLSQVASPIVVDGRLWGAVSVTSRSELPSDTEKRLEKFTELVATAIANAERSAELVASRRRIVAASDEARRRIERDLHDGVQQHLVSLGLDLAAMNADPPTGEALKNHLTKVTEDVRSVLDALMKTARGIHPAILSEGGLTAALRTLARRSTVPVELHAGIGGPVPDEVEVATYYVAAEAITNTAKHARASVLEMYVTTDDRSLTLIVRDDGIGGADPGEGSGLIGLQDRVEALGGTIEIDSRAGAGTSVVVSLPITAALYRGAGSIKA